MLDFATLLASMPPLRVAVWCEDAEWKVLVPDHRCLADRENDPAMRGIMPLDWRHAAYRDNTFADPTQRQEFEATMLTDRQSDNWGRLVNQTLPWDEQDEPDPAVTAGMARARGYLPRESARPARYHIRCTYRDDDTFLTIGNDMVIVVCHLPHDDKWYVLLCEQQRWGLATAKQVLRYRQYTGNGARQGGKARSVLVPHQKLWQGFDVLDEASRAAWQWQMEMTGTDSTVQREIPMDPEVLYTATVNAEDVGGPVRLIAQVLEVHDDDE